MEYVDKLASSAAETSFVAGAEYSSFSLSDILFNAQKQVSIQIKYIYRAVCIEKKNYIPFLLKNEYKVLLYNMPIFQSLEVLYTYYRFHVCVKKQKNFF
jgi:hypothetical protein